MTERDTSFDAFTRARSLKASAMKNVSIMQAAPALFNAQTAPASFEDTIILAFRGEGKLWSDITKHLNERRVARKEALMWTEAAVYSRYIIISSETATPTREVGFEPRDYAHLKNVGSAREGASKAGRKRIKDFQNATELSANTRTPAVVVGTDGQGTKDTVPVKVKDKSNDKAKSKGKDEDRRKGESVEEVVKMDGAMTELLMRAVAKVERNFWVYVADEMEREVGKYIEPKELERAFHRV